MPIFMFRRERYDFYKVRANNKEKAEEILLESFDDEDREESYYSHSEIAMEVTGGGEMPEN